MTDPSTDDRWVDYAPVDEILRAERNPKTHALEELEASMRRFGVVEIPTVDERTGRIVAGHGRLETIEKAVANGDGPPEGVKVDAEGRWLVPLLRGWSSSDDAEAAAYLLASNRTSEIGGWDNNELVAYLDALNDADAGLLGTGYNEDDIAKLLEDLGEVQFTPTLNPEFEGGAVTDEQIAAEKDRLDNRFSEVTMPDRRTEVTCVQCGHTFEVQ